MIPEGARGNRIIGIRDSFFSGFAKADPEVGLGQVEHSGSGHSDIDPMRAPPKLKEIWKLPGEE